MRILTDTHALVWALSNDKLLSAHARAVMAEAEVLASAANLWELVVKSCKKGALIDNPIPWWNKYVAGAGIRTLSIRTSDVSALNGLPDVHRDPFDRILVAQAIVENVPLVTRDQHLREYGITVIW